MKKIDIEFVINALEYKNRLRQQIYHFKIFGVKFGIDNGIWTKDNL